MKSNMKENLEFLERFELTSAICPIVDIGVYDTILSADLLEEDALYNLKEDYHELVDVFGCLGSFDWKQYNEMILNASKSIIDDSVMPILSKYGAAAIKAVEIWNPKEYNHSNSQLYFDVYVVENFHEIFNKNMKEFAKNEMLIEFMRKRYRSYSGFVSFMPQSMDEVAQFEDKERCLACYLTFALLVEGYFNQFGEYDSMYEVYDRIHTYDCPVACCNAYLYCSDEWAAIYRNDVVLNNLIWDVYYKIGRPWETHEMKNILDFCGNINTEADRFVVWATDMGYSPQDLLGMVG